MALLDVPAPTVVLDPPGGPAELEKPVDLAVAPVAFPDGVAVTDEHVVRAGVFLYRLASAGASTEIWAEDAKTWRPAPADPTPLSPLPLAFKAGQPAPWQGTLVAVGQKDGAGQERIAKATAGFPRYRLRALVEARRDGVIHAGLGPFSADWHFVSAADASRFGVAFDTPDTTPKEATRVRVQLKSAALVPAGFLEVRAFAGNEVEIATCDASGTPLASVLLMPTGEIRLRPANGQRVVVEGLLETGEIYYQPAGAPPGKRLLT